MKKILAISAAVLLLLPLSAFAHRLDEYLQATILSVEKDRIQGSMRLIPGVAVSSIVIASIDTNGDGVLSESECRIYAQRVLDDLSLSLNGNRLEPRLVSASFPAPGEMKEGLGEIHIEFTADLPADATNRKLIFENHHQSGISAYLVNALVPRDKNIQITSQNRNENQSFYELDYIQADGSPGGVAAHHTFLPSLSGFAGVFRLGIRHIAEGTDHLLFLLALLLPAPLLSLHHRWAGPAGVRKSLLRILKVVTAFTAGHSITLALAALGAVHVPARPIEVLIAISILVSAVHAIRPLFPGREAIIAAFFGLIHGLAFATALSNLGFGGWYQLVSILGFNLGIETMQLIVVAATLPSFLLLSRSRAYSVLRISAALFAGLAAAGWIVERLVNVHSSVDVVVDSIAHHAVSIAIALFLVSLACWLTDRFRSEPGTALDVQSPTALERI
jgi:HupE / UreJ protein